MKELAIFFFVFSPGDAVKVKIRFFFHVFSLWHGPVWVTKSQKDIGEKDPAICLSSLDTLPETNSKRPWKWSMVGRRSFPFWMAYFQGFRELGLLQRIIGMVDWIIWYFLCDYSVKTWGFIVDSSLMTAFPKSPLPHQLRRGHGMWFMCHTVRRFHRGRGPFQV